MNFQAIFIFIVFLTSVEKAVSLQGKLNEKENRERLDKCGPYKWSMGNVSFLALKVSSRHFLTSTFLIWYKTKWFHDGVPVDLNSCNEKGYIEKSSLQNDTNVLKAFIFCNSEMLKSVKNYSVPMIIEVKEQTNQGFACLPTMNTPIDEGDTLFSFSYNGTDKLADNRLKLLKKEPIRFTTENIGQVNNAPGDPLFKFYSGEWFLVGLRQQSTSTYWNLQYFENQMCAATGICSEEAIKATPPPIPFKIKFTKLSSMENLNRLKECGKVETAILTQSGIPSIATQISERHYLASANLVMRKKGNTHIWRTGPEQDFECLRQDRPIRVPDGLVERMEIDRKKVVGAFVLCHFSSNTLIPSMIVEVENDLLGNFVCLPTQKTLVEPKDLLTAYLYSSNSANNIIEYKTNVTLARDDYIITSSGQTNQYGDPLVKEEDGKAVLVGIYAADPGDVVHKYLLVEIAQKSICGVAGICGPATTTLKPPSSSSPVKMTSETPRKSENQVDPDDIDYEEFYRRIEEWERPEEFDNDLYRSLDFKSGSTKKGIFFVFVLISLFK
uniref:Uncharacterized protein n=1 Tax=Caenorhabditis tropicalis TaxID=1561998 RepID=A0A1I7TAF7_9PELO